MGFLTPWFLIGSLAVGLPLWLHLLRQYKRTPQPFSSLMFFERRVQSSVKHRRLRYIALLCLRVLLILLLTLAFANPFVNRTSTAPNRRTLTVIALDRSFSMHEGNRMQQAKEEARRLADALPGQTLAQILAVDARVEALTQLGAAGSDLKGAIEMVEPNDRASSFGEFARALRSMEQTSGMHLDVHFISDMQQTSMAADFHDLQAGPYVTLHLHRVGEQNPPNWAVENVNAPSSVDRNAPARVTATIAGWNTPAANRRVSLLLDGRELAAKEIAVGASGRAAVEFSDFAVPYGWHKGEIRMEPGDGLRQDDAFSFSIEREDSRKVLFLYASTRNGRGGFYYKAALESGTDAGLEVEALPIANAGGRDFSRFAFVVLSDVGEMDGSVADALCAYVEKGGSVLIAIGPNTARTGVIPLSKEQFNEQRQMQSAAYVDKANAAVASAGQFENVQFSETASFAPKADARVIAKFSDGSPLLVEERAGEGRKLIFASTFDNSTNDFALHASFVPFVVQTARYLARVEDTPSSVVAGTPVTLRSKSSAGAADVIGPDGKHELSLAEAAKAFSFDLERGGFYEISRADGRRIVMAVHADRRESDLRAIPEETLELWRNTGDIADRSPDSVQQAQTRPWRFWRYLLIAAVAAALLESAFASRYLREERRTV